MNMHSPSLLAHTNICTCWPTLFFTIHTANMCMGSTIYYNIICIMGSVSSVHYRYELTVVLANGTCEGLGVLVLLGGSWGSVGLRQEQRDNKRGR